MILLKLTTVYIELHYYHLVNISNLSAMFILLQKISTISDRPFQFLSILSKSYKFYLIWDCNFR